MQADDSPQAPAPVLGFAPMDEIHEEFVHLVRALAEARNEDVLPMLDALARHVHDHFAAEEEWMRSTAFPALECHAAEHAAVLASVDGVRRRALGGDLTRVRALASALADWFPNHADYMDASLAQWMCKLRFGGAPVVLRRAQLSMAGT